MRHRVVIAVLAGAVLLVGTAAPAAAQENTLGVKVGLNLARFSFDEDDFLLESDGRTGLLAGVFITREIQEGFGLQIEGLITQKGDKLEDTFFDEEFDVKLTYLEIPVLGRYTLPIRTGETRVHILAGPAFGLKIGDHQELDGEEIDEDFDQDLKGADIGFALGGAVEFGLFHVDARYTWGLVNINDDEFADDLPVKNRAFTISVGYRFR